MPLALSFVPTQSSAGAPSGWERSLSDVRVFRVRPPPPDVQSLGGRRFPCGSAGIEFEDAALRDKLQSPTRVGVQKYPNQVGAPRPSLGDRESGGGWEAHLGTPRSSPDIRPHLGAEGAAAAEGTARWQTLHPSPRPTVASVRASLEPRSFYRCWTGRQEAASSCGLFSRAGLGEPGKETDSGAGARFPHVGMAPLRSWDRAPCAQGVVYYDRWDAALYFAVGKTKAQRSSEISSGSGSGVEPRALPQITGSL